MTLKSTTSHSYSSPLDNSQLIDGCEHCLSQCESLLKQLATADYVECAGGASVGAHVRHVLERFESFFAGLPGGYIDYDNRKRDPRIETDPAAAVVALAMLAPKLRELDLASDPAAGVKVRESVYHAGPAVTLWSTVPRELMGLITHSTHHLAIIGLLIKPLGYTPEEDFGKAASTIRFERRAPDCGH